MTWYLIQDKEKIIKVIERLILKQIEIEVLIQGQDTRYYSRFIEIVPGPHRGDTSEIDGEALELIIEKLVPKSGNSLIPKLPEVAIQFPAEEYLCRCQTKHAFMGRTTPHYGLIMSFPKFLELEEKRREERTSLGLPEFLCAVFQVKEGHGKDRIYELDVINWSAHGLALLVSEKDYNLLAILNKGNKISEITLFAESALISCEGTVRHIAEIAGGEFKGKYTLGLELNTPIAEAMDQVSGLRGG